MRIGVMGAGVMGSGIAQVTATAGYDTVCYDVSADALKAAREHVTTGRFGLDGSVAATSSRASRPTPRSTACTSPTRSIRPRTPI